ncbi:serine-rich adhesin for platelets isoform X1 [Bradysia coprophila]|uniref:serine-rich adhesin for platelets isoform X1 n=1 Tax=Bradysia coprophila TaxID=38358 RepID=UPI00187D739A|nr:serine-rich adhesin for platelets isoform X1 [Bradysia coprophila]
MFFKVTWLTVMVLLIIPEKDMAKAQNTDLTSAESRAWRRSDILDPDVPTNMQPPEEFNQEPMRRRRRKRKRRPQPQEPNYQLGDAERTNYWHGEMEDESDHENGGITVSVNGVRGIQNINTEVWHNENERTRINNPNKSEFVQEMVMQVADNVKPDDATNKSYRKPYVVPKKDDEKDGESPASDLKNLLKNSGGLSLSEILQKQNLSLDDLLKGKQNAFKVLQNTAAPAPTENAESKGVRRIPAIKRPFSTVASIEQVDSNLPSPSNDNKQIKRIPNFIRARPDAIEENKESAVTLSKFMVPPSPTSNLNPATSTKPSIRETVTIAANVRGISAVRRLPASNVSEKTKPIKEVVSRIRPDLSNSNSRRRLLPIQFRSNPVNTTVPTNTRQDSKVRLPLRYGNAPKVGSKTKINDELPNDAIESSTTEFEVVTSTSTPLFTSSSTTTSLPVSQVTTEVVKDIVKSRLALKPRLKIPHLLPNPTTATTTTTTMTPTTTTTTTTTTEAPTNADSTEISSIEQSSSETEMTTVSSIDEILSEDEEEKLLFSSEEEFKEILDQSEPEINSILEEFALYNGRKSVVPIEDLFEDSQGVEADTFRTFTSRSDKMAITDRTIDFQKDSVKYQQDNSRSINGKVDVTERNPSLFNDITSMRTTDDKTDILELLDDRRGGARLTKVLEQRNMTLEELLEHRKRGSSQLHLAEIVNNKTRPLTNVHAADKLDIVAAFENFPNFNLPNIKSVRPDDVRTDSDGASYFTSIINIKPTDEISKEGRSLKRDDFPKQMPPTGGHFNPWKTINYPSQDVNYIDTAKKNIISSSRISPFDNEVEQIENEVARSHDFVDLELSGHGFKPNSVSIETASMPVGVRSAIIASASIVGICLIIFILIFATCRWRQKQRKKLNYSENFQTVRGRLPILARNSTSSSSTTKRSSSPNIFTTTGSRSSKLNTMDPNSPEVQEYLYDAMRKSFR